MNNYIYIIASIPQLSQNDAMGGQQVEGITDWIMSQLDESDRRKAALVLDGFTPSKLNADFYTEAFKARDGFTREFFANDLALRNAKVRYLNNALGREAETDVINVEGAPEVSSGAEIAKIFAGDNLLEREKAIDDFLWSTADSITLMMNFKLSNILAIIAKLCIIGRWMALDESKGRELLGTLVNGIRGSYGSINFEQFR